MGSEDMEEKDMAPAVAAEEVAAGEEGAVKKEESVGEEVGEFLVKSARNDELNSKISHDVGPGDVDVGESVVAVAGSVDGSVEAPVRPGVESGTVSRSVDPEPAPSSGVVDATEKVESWDLSEAVAKNVQDGDEKEDLKPKISEEGSPEDVETQDAPLVSVDSIEDSVGGEPVSVSSNVEDEAENSEHAGGVTEVPSEIGGSEDVSPEIPAEGSAEKVESEAVDVPVEEVHEVVEATSAEPDEELAGLETVPSPSDEGKSVEVNSEDFSKVAAILPSESADNEGESSEIPAEGPSDNAHNEMPDAPVESEGPEAPVESEGLEAPVESEDLESPVESEGLEAPVESEGLEAPVESEGLEAPIESEGLEAPIESEGLKAPVESEGPAAQVVHEVVEPTTSAEADEGSASLEPVSTPADDVEEKFVDEDTSEANTMLPSESADYENVSPKVPDEGSVDNVGSEALYAPAEEVHEVVESTIIAEPDGESTKAESVSAPPDDVEDKSVVVNSRDVSEATTTLESADNEVASPEHPAEESADNVSSGALELEAVHEVVEPTISAEPNEESAEPESVSAPDHAEYRSIELNSEDTNEAITVLPSESADNEVVSSELSADKVDQIGEIEDTSTDAKPDEDSAGLKSVSAPPDDIEDKPIDVNSEDVTEAITESDSADNGVVSPEFSAEESADNVSSEAVDAQALHEVVESTTSEEPVEEAAEPESVSTPSDNVEDKSIDVNSEDVTMVTTTSESADNEDVSPEPSAEEPSDNDGSEALYAPVEEVHEVVEATITAEPNEESAEPESVPVPAPSDDVEDKSVAVNSRDVTGASTESESADNEIASPELPAEESAGNVSSEPLEPEAVHEVVEPTSAEIDEESVEPESVSTPDDVANKSVEVKSEDTSEAVIVLSSESADNEVVSPELPAEGSTDKVDAPVEEIGEISDAATNAKPDDESASLESVAAPSDDAQSMLEEVEPEVSALEMDEEIIMASSIPLPVEEELFDLLEYEREQSEVSHEGSAENGIASNGVDTVTDITENDTAEHTSEEPLGGATSGDVHDNLLGLSSEKPSDLSLESHAESLSAEDGVALVDRCIQVEELSQESAAESQISVSMDAEVNAGDEEGIAEGGDTIKEESPDTQSVSANENFSVEDESHLLQTEMTDEEAADVATQPVEDVSHMLQIEMTDEEAADVATQPVEDVSHMLQTVMTDEEVKLAAAHHPENSIASEESVEDETPALESENSHGESSIPLAEASGASQANEVETVSRELDFNDFSEAPTTSEVVRESGDESLNAVTSEQVTPYLATALTTASGEKGISSDAAASDTTPLEISSPPPVVENEVAPRSYNLDEVATNLHDAAEKTLEDAKSSNIGDRQASIAQSVAQIVLDESSKTGDPSEYISGVVQHVAQLAQDAGQSDPNILPDTVARVFDGETAGSPANEASQTKETTSLGTMISLFIVWCVSLCASRISSKDMPAPALKLAAEEVAAVLHSNAPSQPAPPQEAASSNH